MTSLRHRLSAAALSAVAVLAAHEISYRAVVPDAHERVHLLEESGHGWWGIAPFLVGAALAIAVLATAGTKTVNRFRWVLAPATTLLYVSIETAERIIGQSHHGAVHLPTLAAGAGIALVFGLLAATLLRLGEEVTVALKTRNSNPNTDRARWLVAPATLPAQAYNSSCPSRGPPSFLRIAY